MNIKPQYASFDIANKYNYRTMLTPPYHPEVQPIEKVWAIIKNPIAYNPDPEETLSLLREKLVVSLKNVSEKSLISVWKKSIDSCKEYQDEFYSEKDPLDLEHEDEDEETGSG